MQAPSSLEQEFLKLFKAKDINVFRSMLETYLKNHEGGINTADIETGNTLLAFFCANTTLRQGMVFIRALIEEYDACPDFVNLNGLTALQLLPSLQHVKDRNILTHTVEAYRKKHQKDFAARSLIPTASIASLEVKWGGFLKSYGNQQYQMLSYDSGEGEYKFVKVNNSPIVAACKEVIWRLKNHLFVSSVDYDNLAVPISTFLRQFAELRTTLLFDESSVALTKYQRSFDTVCENIVSDLKQVTDKHKNFGAVAQGKKIAKKELAPKLAEFKQEANVAQAAENKAESQMLAMAESLSQLTEEQASLQVALDEERFQQALRLSEAQGQVEAAEGKASEIEKASAERIAFLVEQLTKLSGQSEELTQSFERQGVEYQEQLRRLQELRQQEIAEREIALEAAQSRLQTLEKERQATEERDAAKIIVVQKEAEDLKQQITQENQEKEGLKEEIGRLREQLVAAQSASFTVSAASTALSVVSTPVVWGVGAVSTLFRAPVPSEESNLAMYDDRFADLLSGARVSHLQLGYTERGGQNFYCNEEKFMAARGGVNCIRVPGTVVKLKAILQEPDDKTREVALRSLCEVIKTDKLVNRKGWLNNSSPAYVAWLENVRDTITACYPEAGVVAASTSTPTGS